MNVGYHMKFPYIVLAGVAIASADITGTVVDESGKPIQDAVVSIKTLPNLLPDARTLSDANGVFTFEMGGSSLESSASGSTEISSDSETGEISSSSMGTAAESSSSGTGGVTAIRKMPMPRGVFTLNTAGVVSLRALDMNGKVVRQVSISAGDGNYAVENASSLVSGMARGTYLLVASVNGKHTMVGKITNNGNGGSVALRNVGALESQAMYLAAKEAESSERIVIRKAGFLPETLSVENPKDYGKITLKRDPIEDKIDALMADMNLDAKIAQMTQPQSGYSCGGYACGSTLNGGGDYAGSYTLGNWKSPIPTIYGKDNVHGMGDVDRATIFPHNIGLGATRDSALVRRIGQAVAEEMWAAYIDLNFAPAVSTPQDEHWGRVYEGFGEKAELGVMMGAAYLRGLQGDNMDAPWRVIGTVKHFVGDGATDGGKDRGNSTMTEEQLRTIHLPPYIAAVEQGAQSVMASFSQINGVHQHVDSLRLTGILKVELGFDGYVIADWEGIDNSRTPGQTDALGYGGGSTMSSSEAVRKAINAGIDLAMVPTSHSSFRSTLKTLVQNGQVSEDRINDAVRRILRVKVRAGRIDNPAGPAAYVGKTENIGSAAHRAIAREAVRKSLVLLKNEGKALPLSKSGKVFVTGTHANNTGYQCGGWTQGWQGSTSNIPGATSILSGAKEVANTAIAASANDAETIVYVVGETPYAEWLGDVKDFEGKYVGPVSSQVSQINTWKAAGKKVVVVLISGRALPFADLVDAADAFVAAWLPGSEGAGVADVLFGDYKPTGKLPHTWPKSADQIPINDGDGQTGLFPYGFGLSY